MSVECGLSILTAIAALLEAIEKCGDAVDVDPALLEMLVETREELEAMTDADG